MLRFGLIIIIAIGVYCFLFKDEVTVSKKENNAPPAPPSSDVVVLGCNNICGYFTPEFRQNARGDYEGTRMVYCSYQKKTVRQGSKCPFAKEHPDLLEKSIFDDENFLEYNE